MKKKIISIVLLGICAATFYFFLRKDGSDQEISSVDSSSIEIEEPGKEYDEEAMYDSNNQITLAPRKMNDTDEDYSKPIHTIRLDTPQESQLAEPALENGGGITALSMLLNYYHFNVNKNGLAESLPIAPYEKEGIHGNPTEAFVGELESGKALGVYATPLAKIAQEIVGDEYEVIAENNTSFEMLLEQVQNNHPVWIATSEDLKVPNERKNQSWPTDAGVLTVPEYIHAVVIVGMDQYRVYVNDPLGEKETEIKIGEMKDIYEKMGSQSLYLKTK